MNTTQVKVETVRLAVLRMTDVCRGEYDKNVQRLSDLQRQSPTGDYTHRLNQAFSKVEGELARLEMINTLIRVSDSDMINIDGETAVWLWG